MWRFDKKFPNMTSSPWSHHALHGADLPYTFGLPDSMSRAFDLTPEIQRAEWPLSKAIMTYWTNFAKTGNPNQPITPAVLWPALHTGSWDHLAFKGDNGTSFQISTQTKPSPER